MVESSKYVRPWRQDVKFTVLENRPPNWPMDAPIAVSAVFMFERPKGHFSAKGGLKPSAPIHHTARRGDIEKLLRSTFDALHDVTYLDDAQVVSVNALRRYTTANERQGAILTFTTLK